MTRYRTRIFTCLALLPAAALAGSLDNRNAPSGGSGMPSITQIYNRLTTGGTIDSPGPFLEPTAGPASTGKSLADIQGVLPVPDTTNGATAAEVLSGKTFWGLIPGTNTWGVQTGSLVPPAAPTGDATADQVLSGATFSNATGTGLTGSMPNNGAVSITPGTTDQTIAAGYHSGSGTVAGDANLQAGNIKAGTTIFGVTGSLSYIPQYRIVNKTGQTQCWDASGTSISCASTGQDGQYQYGIAPAVAPSSGETGAYNTPPFSGTRFIDNGNGTVTDSLGGLIWQKDSTCHGLKNWSDALSACNTLATGTCSLSDGSTAGQWRLPNINELHSLGPTWPLTVPFVGNLSFGHWSSTTNANYANLAWAVGFYYGYVDYYGKGDNGYVRCVRGGQ